MAWIDTHTHLYLKEFDQDRADVVTKAKEAGVSELYLPNIDSTTVESMFKMCDDFPNSRPMVGLHPGSVKENWEEELRILKPYSTRKSVIAIGEIGMDLYWDKTFIEEQRLAFREQVDWAKECKLPIVIHAREAFDELFDILDDVMDERLTGVFHCFTGNLDHAKKIMTYPGFLMGKGGVVTYKKAKMGEVLQHVPLTHLIMETDAPYLSPVPYRGKRNESAYLVHSGEKLAEIHEVPLTKVEEITTQNARRLFNT